MTQPHPDMEHYDEWLDTQIAIGAELAAEHEQVSEAVRTELGDATRHAVQWLGVPEVLRVVAATIDAIDQAQADADDCPF